jgi:serine/threonine protein phosphatase PrpC
MNCPACGTPAAPESRFCEACGAALAESAGDASGPENRAADRCELDLAPDLAAVSDRGLVHASNEDAVVVARHVVGGRPIAILVVCDGVSSSRDPALGAATAARAAAEALRIGAESGQDATQLMRAAILDAHAAVCALVPADASADHRPFTTIVAALAGPGPVAIGWVGDSRAYLLGRQNRVLTRDDSWVNSAVEQGLMTEAEAMRSPNAHAIVQCLGDPDDIPEPHVVTTAIAPGEKLLLCSDGLWNYAPSPEALGQVSRCNDGARTIDLCRALIAFANAAGGHDNITATVLAVS